MGSKFVGIDLDWDYTKCTCHLAMKNYINKVLLKYGHPKPTKPQLSPHKHTEIQYGATAQYAHALNTSPQLDEAGIKWVQGIMGALLYYAWAIANS